MAENSGISWTKNTFSPWKGCTEVSAACDHCYARELIENRFHQAKWGNHPRQPIAESTWKQPLAWNRKAAKLGVRHRVFCASTADVFDNHKSILPEWRADLWALIKATPHLDWMLLTKRPQNIKKYLPDDWDTSSDEEWPKSNYPNVWLGVTVENQTEANRRIPILLDIPCKLRFLSCEPLLGEMDLMPWLLPQANVCQVGLDMAVGEQNPSQTAMVSLLKSAGRHMGWRGIDWVIAGGESGKDARPSNPSWFRSLRDQCEAANVPFHFKQWGEWAPRSDWDILGGDDYWKYDHLGHPKPRFKAHTLNEKDGAVDRVGKKIAGRLLDGQLHDAFPKGGE